MRRDVRRVRQAPLDTAATRNADGVGADSRRSSGVAPQVEQPAHDDSSAWEAYWQAQGQPWRREPEIAPERQAWLARRRARAPDPQRGRYPFTGVALTRADIEWLLATHTDDGGDGPVEWDDVAQREREGIDLRGASLRGVDLRGLPLARLRGSLTEGEWRTSIAEQIAGATAQLDGADLSDARLEGALLEGAQLTGARLRGARMAAANLRFATLVGSNATGADLTDAQLLGATLEGAALEEVWLTGANLSNAKLAGADLDDAHLEGASLAEATLAGRALEADERERFGGREALPGASLCGARLDGETALDEATLGDPAFGSVALADLRWGGVNLAVVDWSCVEALGDERAAWAAQTPTGQPKDEATRIGDFKAAARANRQLAVALREQGLNEEADRFAYRAQRLQRQVALRQAFARDAALLGARRGSLVAVRRAQRLGSYIFSLFLDALAGYGYKPGRSLVAYLGTLLIFTLAYHALGATPAPPISWINAMALSVNSFHGRGFTPGNLQANDAMTVLTAIEATVGLVIELSFIATVTQRFFAR